MVRFAKSPPSGKMLLFRNTVMVFTFSGSLSLVVVGLAAGQRDAIERRLITVTETREKVKVKRLKLEDELLQLRALQEERAAAEQRKKQAQSSWWPF